VSFRREASSAKGLDQIIQRGCAKYLEIHVPANDLNRRIESLTALLGGNAVESVGMRCRPVGIFGSPMLARSIARIVPEARASEVIRRGSQAYTHQRGADGWPRLARRCEDPLS
jgi:hypothetical protein